MISIFSLVILAMLLGFFIAIFGLYGWYIPLVPIAVMALIALWIAPDVDTGLDPLVQKIWYVYLCFVLMWPNYLAFNIPGLPWISPQRIFLTSLTCLFLYALAISARLRSEVGDVLKSHQLLLRFFVAWLVIQSVMMLVGKAESASRWMNHQMGWHLMFVVTAWLVSKPDGAMRFARLILVAAALISGVVIPEFINMRPIWVDHIPSFLSISPDLMESLMFGVGRAGEYRARSIFINSLVLSEVIGMLLPFVMLGIVWAKNGWLRAASVALFVLMFTAGYLTQARTAMAVTAAGIPLFAGIYVWRRYVQSKDKSDLVSPALLAMFPAGALAFVGAVFFVPRLRTMVFGNSGHRFSNNAREVQWEMALRALAKNPVGHGMGSIDRVVPYRNLAGKFTIDSYPINLLIEHGVPGFLAFVGFFACAAIMGVKVFVNSPDREGQVAGAAAVGIMSFMLSRLVLSIEAGQWLAFTFAGVILGLFYRQVRQAAAQRADRQQVA